MSQKTTLYFLLPNEAGRHEEQIPKGRRCRAKEFVCQFALLGATITLVGRIFFQQRTWQNIRGGTCVHDVFSPISTAVR